MNKELMADGIVEVEGDGFDVAQCVDMTINDLATDLTDEIENLNLDGDYLVSVKVVVSVRDA